MKKYKIIKVISLIFLIIFILSIIVDFIVCINMKYPHPMLGIEAYNWKQQFVVDLIIKFSIWGIPIIVDIVLLIISIKKTKKVR